MNKDMHSYTSVLTDRSTFLKQQFPMAKYQYCSLLRYQQIFFPLEGRVCRVSLPTSVIVI
jgi:hypothetical protein